MLVPLKHAQRPSRRGTDESTSSPGAVTSGFMRSDIGVGPPEEKDEMNGPLSLSAAAVIALAELPGEVTEPRAKLLVVVAGGDDGHDTGRGGSVERAGDDVAARVDLGLAEREVDHVHPVPDRGLDARRRSRREFPFRPKSSSGTVSTL